MQSKHVIRCNGITELNLMANLNNTTTATKQFQVQLNKLNFVLVNKVPPFIIIQILVDKKIIFFGTIIFFFAFAP